MRIPETLFYCIKTELGISCFESINMRSVIGKRSYRSRTPEEIAAFKKACSDSQKKRMRNDKSLVEARSRGVREYWKNLSKRERKRVSKERSKVQKAVWENMTDEERAYRGKKRSDFMKKFWKENRGVFDPNKKVRATLEKDVPRINTYSGVITESQLEEVS